jgi:DNA-binding NtrC family response regulator
MSQQELISQLAASKVSLHELKLAYIYETLRSCGGNKNNATKILGLNRSYISALIKRYGWNEFFGWVTPVDHNQAQPR